MMTDDKHESHGEPTQISAEELALLIDGRLDAKRRAHVLEALSSSPGHLEMYADIIAVVRELESDQSTENTPSENTPIVPLTDAPSVRRTRTWRFVSIAAAAVLLVSIGVQLSRGTSEEPKLGTPASTIAMLAKTGAPISMPSRAFDVTRGIAVSGAPSGIGVQVGVGIAEATRLVGASDSASVLTLMSTLERVGQLLDRVPAGTVAGQTFHILARNPRSDSFSIQLQLASDQAEQFVDPRALRVGAWLSTLRMAVMQRDTTFLRASSTRAGLEDLRRLLADKAASGGTVAELEQAIGAMPIVWLRIEELAVTHLRELSQK